MRPWDRRTAAAGIGVVSLAAIAIWLLARPDRRESSDGMEACAQLYRDARTLADTIRVDGQTPMQGGNREHDAVTCGVLRATYPYRVVPIP